MICEECRQPIEVGQMFGRSADTNRAWHETCLPDNGMDYRTWPCAIYWGVLANPYVCYEKPESGVEA